MEERTLEQLNQTELSQAMKKLVSPEYLEEHNLILAAAMSEYLYRTTTSTTESRWYRYVAERALEQIDRLEWLRNDPQTLYMVLTTLEASEAGEEEDLPMEDEFLEMTRSTDKEEWVLGTVCQEMLDAMRTWYDLSPEFPELL